MVEPTATAVTRPEALTRATLSFWLAHATSSLAESSESSERVTRKASWRLCPASRETALGTTSTALTERLGPGLVRLISFSKELPHEDTVIKSEAKKRSLIHEGMTRFIL